MAYNGWEVIPEEDPVENHRKDLTLRRVGTNATPYSKITISHLSFIYQHFFDFVWFSMKKVDKEIFLEVKLIVFKFLFY